MAPNFQRARKSASNRSTSYNPQKEKNKETKADRNSISTNCNNTMLAFQEIIKMRKDIGKYINLRDKSVLYAYNWTTNKYSEFDKDIEIEIDTETHELLKDINYHVKICNFVVASGAYFINEHAMCTGMKTNYENRDTKRWSTVSSHDKDIKTARTYKNLYQTHIDYHVT